MKKLEKRAEYESAHSTIRIDERSENPIGGLPDRRVLERLMAQTLGLDGGRSSEESDADDLFYQALEVDDPEARIDLLKAALVINPRHIDALVELAQFSDGQTAFDILSQAITFGKEELQDELRNHVGHFWGLHHTRPFMRAKQALVERLLEDRLWHDATDEMEQMLELNPNDNQGMRWMLMEAYCHLDRIDDAENLARAYPEEGLPFLPFTNLLIQFKKKGDSSELRAALGMQSERNPHIILRLLDPMLINREENATFAPCSPEEADLYCRQFLPAWKSTPGAITWLRAASRGLPSKNDEAVGDELFDGNLFNGDVKAEIQKLRIQVKKLDPCDEAWFCDAHDASQQAAEGWILSIIDEGTDEAIYMDPGEGLRTADTVLHGLLHSMLEPDFGPPRRPTVVNFIDAQLHKSLKARLQRLEITTNLVDQKPALLDFIDRTLDAKRQPVDIDAIQDAPMLTTTWEVDWRQLEMRVPNEDGEPVQPWMVMVAHENGLILSQEVSLTPPDSEQIFNAIAQAVLKPAEGDPERPMTITTTSTEHLLDLKATADAIGAKCVVGECLMIDQMFESLLKHMTEVAGGPPALMSIPGVVPEVVGGFFESAATFYQAHPWSYTPPDTVVTVRCSELLHAPWYAVIMGQMGEALGIMLFDDRKSLELLLRLDPADTETGATEMRGIAFSLNEEQMMPPRDVAAAEQFGWPVAAPEAWPTAYFVSDADLQPLGIAELQFLSAAIPAVVAQLQTRKSSLVTSVALPGQTVSVSTTRE